MGKRGPAPGAARSAEPRTRRLDIALSEREYETLESAAGGDRKKLAGFVRSRALESAKGDQNRAAPELSPELRRIGGNINQLAKRANSGERVSQELRPVLTSLAAELQRIREQLQ